MRPRYRILPISLAAAAAALAVATPAVARHTQPEPQHKRARMSSNIPYIAPWQTAFTRYATQLFTPAKVSNMTLQVTVAAGQWWRFIYLTGRFDTSVAAGNRSVAIEVLDAGGTIVFQEYAPVTVGPNSIMTVLFAPALTAFSDTAVALHQQATAPIPDALWPPGDTIRLQAYDVDAADLWIAPVTFAVEIYGEERPEIFVPVPTVTPLLS